MIQTYILWINPEDIKVYGILLNFFCLEPTVVATDRTLKAFYGNVLKLFHSVMCLVDILQIDLKVLVNGITGGLFNHHRKV